MVCAKPRFETDTWGNSEMTYFSLPGSASLSIFFTKTKVQLKCCAYEACNI